MLVGAEALAEMVAGATAKTAVKKSVGSILQESDSLRLRRSVGAGGNGADQQQSRCWVGACSVRVSREKRDESSQQTMKGGEGESQKVVRAWLDWVWPTPTLNDRTPASPDKGRTLANGPVSIAPRATAAPRAEPAPEAISARRPL